MPTTMACAASRGVLGDDEPTVLGVLPVLSLPTVAGVGIEVRASKRLLRDPEGVRSRAVGEIRRTFEDAGKPEDEIAGLIGKLSRIAMQAPSAVAPAPPSPRRQR